MDVLELTTAKSAVVFDVSAIMPSKDQVERFMHYSTGMNNFIQNSAKVKLAFIRMPAESNIKSTNVPMELTKDPLPDLLQKVGKAKPKVLVIFAHVTEALENAKDIKAKSTLIVTDDEITPQILSKASDSVKIIPSRVLNTFCGAFWWRITPYEQIEEKDLQSGVIPDGSINEINLMGQMASMRYGEQKYDECFDLLEMCLQMYPKHMETHLVFGGLLLQDVKNNRLPDQREAQLAQAQQLLLEMNDLMQKTKLANKKAETNIMMLGVKLHKVVTIMLPMLPPDRAAVIQKAFSL